MLFEYEHIKDGLQIVVKENEAESMYLVVYNEKITKFILIPCCNVEQLYEKDNINQSWTFDFNDYISVNSSEICYYLDFKNTIIIENEKLVIFNKIISVIDNKIWYFANKENIIKKFMTSEAYTNNFANDIEFYDLNNHNVNCG